MSEAWLEPGTHGVRFFDDAPSTHRAIARFFTAGGAGDPLLLVSRRETFDGVTALLASGRYGPPMPPGRIRYVDAESAPAQFMTGDYVNAARAEAVLLDLLAAIRREQPSGTVRWYGEMVDVLCERKNFKAALAVEEMCDKLFASEPKLTILCGYARARFDGAGAQVFHAVCTGHTHASAGEGTRGALEEGGAPPPRSDEGSPGNRAYIIDDDDSVRRSLGRFLKLAGLDVRTFGSGEAFLLELETLRPGCVVVDIQLGGMNGHDILSHMTSTRPNWPLIAMSGSDDDDARSEALRLGARVFLHKPLDSQVLLETIEAALVG
jgi:two-component system response regulator FixJ